MEALIDTNVILTYLTGRDRPDHDACIRIMKLCTMGEINGSVAFHSLSNIWYILERTTFKDRRREFLKEVVDILTVYGASGEKVQQAIEWGEFEDFEDCLQYECAKEAGADYIITANIKDFTEVKDIKVVTAIEASELFDNKQDDKEDGDE